jgi:molybdopterin synthase sulfur carrier subunit
LTAGKAEISGEGSTIVELFDNLEGSYKGLKEKVFDDAGAIRRFIIVSVNGEDVRYLKGPETPVKAGDEISIVPAIAGGQ